MKTLGKYLLAIVLGVLVGWLAGQVIIGLRENKKMSVSLPPSPQFNHDGGAR